MSEPEKIGNLMTSRLIVMPTSPCGKGATSRQDRQHTRSGRAQKILGKAARLERDAGQQRVHDERLDPLRELRVSDLKPQDEAN